MKKKWDEIKVENLKAKNIEAKVYKQVLDEVARMIYDEVCQLHQNSNLGPVTLEDQLLQRTGTDA